MQCEKCKTENREIAKFCKKCGTTVTSAVAAVSLGCSIDDLVGLDNIKSELQDLQAILEGMKQEGSKERYAFNTIIIGTSGTAKTLISNLIADLFYKFGMVTKSQPLIKQGEDVAGLNQEKMEALLKAAQGGLLFIDSAQNMVGGFQTLINCMDMAQYKNDPIVLMAGLPFGLREFVANPENKHFTGRFQKIFKISDYSPDQHVAITQSMLKKQGYSFSSEAEEKLQKRFRWLFKDLKKPNTEIIHINGKLAEDEARLMRGSYYKRKASDKIILPQDIKEPVEEKKTIEEIMAELDSIIGMTELKKQIKSLYTQVQQETELAKKGGKSKKPANHFIITGNPGTGKTTVARMLGKIFEGIGVLGSGHVIEVDRKKLVAEFVGQTGPKTDKACDDALGGILFIDEAYGLYKDENDSFGIECIEALLKRMEDDRDKFMVVAAGYKDKIDKFLTANDGLPSRFNNKFHLEDYTAEELTEIFMVFAKEDGIIVPPETKAKAKDFFKDRIARKTKDFANGREARNMFNEAKQNKAIRFEEEGVDISAMSNDEALTLLPSDIPATASDKMVTVEDALVELNKLVGLKSVKDAVAKIADTLQVNKITGETEPLSKHFVFTGNPGTGKTTVARIMGNVLHALGMLPTSTVVEVKKEQMVSKYQNETSEFVNKQCDNAMGGILFIDEAYNLVSPGGQDKAGDEAVTALLTRLENDRGKFVCIAAGYAKEMEDFISSNAGLESRFTNVINFDDYKPEEMREIFIGISKKAKKEFGDGFDEALEKKLKEMYARKTKKFANARAVRNLFDATKENLSSRIIAMKKSGVSEDDMKREAAFLHPQDIPGHTESEKELSIDDVLKELNEMIGLKSVKDSVAKIADTLKVQKISGKTKIIEKHFVFTGNPGTGKTTVARILGNVFKALGLLPTNKLVEVKRSLLVAGYEGQTGPLVNKQCDSALGGILFIDEAYDLVRKGQDPFGNEAVTELLQRLENDRGKFICIVAGYTKNMDDFLASNPGFGSRFTDTINFEDYSPAEMREIFISMCKKDEIEFGDGFDDALQKRLADLFAKKSKQFANARTVRNIYNATIANLSSRVAKMQKSGSPDDEVKREVSIMRPEDLDMTVS